MSWISRAVGRGTYAKSQAERRRDYKLYLQQKREEQKHKEQGDAYLGGLSRKHMDDE